MSESTCVLCGKDLEDDSGFLCELHRYVAHRETMTIGEIARVHPPGTRNAVTEPVVELTSGHAFVLRPGAFAEVTPPWFAVYRSLAAMFDRMWADFLVVQTTDDDRLTFRLLMRAAFESAARRRDFGA